MGNQMSVSFWTPPVQKLKYIHLCLSEAEI